MASPSCEAPSAHVEPWLDQSIDAAGKCSVVYKVFFFFFFFAGCS